MARTPHVAVILAGCGHLDGAEVREAVLTLLALDQHGAKVQCLAPDAPQHDVVDHGPGQPLAGQSRNMLQEAGRIARVGRCLDLAKADPADYDALLLPGGFGVAKNLCDFALRGPEGETRPDVLAFVSHFFENGKPVGAICISPALVALCLKAGGRSATLTLGNDAGVRTAMDRLCQRHQDTASAREIVVDEALKLVTTPAYMFGDARLADVWTGIERCVDEVMRRI